MVCSATYIAILTIWIVNMSLPGISNCGINFHLLLHLTFYVRHFGPLWTHLAFPFESQMFNFLSSSHASHGIGK